MKAKVQKTISKAEFEYARALAGYDTCLADDTVGVDGMTYLQLTLLRLGLVDEDLLNHIRRQVTDLDVSFCLSCSLSPTLERT